MTYTETAWTPSEALTYEEWAEAGRSIQQISLSANWWLGDWVNYGEARYGEKYTQAIELTGNKLEQLKKCAYVARQVAPDMRRESLTWTHHLHVASLARCDQAELLDSAEARGWSSATMKQRADLYRMAHCEPVAESGINSTFDTVGEVNGSTATLAAGEGWTWTVVDTNMIRQEIEEIRQFTRQYKDALSEIKSLDETPRPWPAMTGDAEHDADVIRKTWGNDYAAKLAVEILSYELPY